MIHEPSAPKPKGSRKCGCPLYLFRANKMDKGIERMHHALTCRHYKSKFFGWEKA